MNQAFAILAILCWLFLAFKSYRTSSLAIPLYSSFFVVEQILQATFPIFTTYYTILNYALLGWILVLSLKSHSLLRATQLSVSTYTLYALIVYSTLSFSWSADPTTSINVTLRFLPYTIVGALFLPTFVLSKTHFDDAIRGLVHITGVLLPTLLALGVGSQGRALLIALSEDTNVSGSPLAIATFAATGLLASFITLFKRRQLRRDAVTLALSISNTILAPVVIVATGSRGQLVAPVIALAVAYLGSTAFGNKRAHDLKLRAAPITAAMMLLAVGSSTLLEDIASSGLRRVTYGAYADNYLSTRGTLVGNLLQHYEYEVARSPIRVLIGLGSGSSFTVQQTYCHVLPVEIFVDYGLIGFSIFAFWITLTFFSLRQLYRTSARHLTLTVSAMFLLFFTLSLKQGSFYMHSELFCWSAIASTLATKAPEHKHTRNRISGAASASNSHSLA